MADPQIRIRRATPADAPAAFDVFVAAVRDLTQRQGAPWKSDPEQLRIRLRPILEHLAATAAEWWVAEDVATGQLTGHARSIERGGLFELAEFFVHPDRQSAGVGGELLAKAFPVGRGEVRVIIATTDVRAQARYYRAGVAARFPIAEMARPPQRAEPGALAELEALPATPADLATLNTLEAAVLEFPRGEDEFGWLLTQREGYLYRRNGEIVGSGFVGQVGFGPVATLDPADQPLILLHLEDRAAQLGRENLALEVPMINEVAMRHLLSRGFQLDPFITLLMSSRPFGQFDRFIGFAPPFVL